MKNEIQQKLNTLERRVAESYKTKSNDCKRCEEYCEEKQLPLHGLLSFFHIGEEFENDRYGVVFVGKTHWYNKSQVEELQFLCSRFRDCRDNGTTMLLTRQSRFWGCIQDIAMQLYPEGENDADMILNHISVTNLTKCNTSEKYQDTTPYYLTENCIELFEQEIRSLRPKHIIFFTGRGYDSYIDKLNFGYSIKDITKRMDKREITNRKEIKNKSVLWWHREFYENSKLSMHFLRTRHPQGAPRELKDGVANWIKNSTTQREF